MLFANSLPISMQDKLIYSFRHLTKLSFFLNFIKEKKNSILYISSSCIKDIMKIFFYLKKKYNNIIYIKLKFLYCNEFLEEFISIFFSNHIDIIHKLKNIIINLKILFIITEQKVFLYKKGD